MAKSGKFAALAEFRHAPASPEAPPGPVDEPAPAKVPEPPPAAQSPPVEPSRTRGRPPGKRSDPAWKLFSHFLKKKTQREAAALLLDRDDGRDLSDVLQSLLERWLKEERTGD